MLNLDSVADALESLTTAIFHTPAVAEWQAYLAGLLETHARKYKLVPMLRGIR